MSSIKLSYVLIIIGIAIMISGIGFSGLMSVVGIGPVTVSDINPPSATAIGVGAIILIIGVGLYSKGK